MDIQITYSEWDMVLNSVWLSNMLQTEVICGTFLSSNLLSR
jgi:autonomous glycyl radical cofactor GrcA